jgi:hypothetical protein
VDRREADKVRYGRQARREGESLGARIREAVAEPDWEEHRKVIDASRSEGIDTS